jgi:two-component system sensor histidine kinase/response regulator
MKRMGFAVMGSDENYPTTILFVDDNAALLRSVERLLRLEGFRVLLASDGLDALQQLETQVPELIISDITMPQMDGFELFETVRQRDEWLDIPFLFLTARDQIDDLRRGYSLGADDYLVKPLDQERLLLVIQSKLKRRSEISTWIQMQQQALDAAKRELAMMVAHELRTPLVSINIVSDILTREIDTMQSDQVQDMLEMMQNGSVRLSRLIEQMVMFVQWQSGALADSIQAPGRGDTLYNIVFEAIKRVQRFGLRRPAVPVHLTEYGTEIIIRGDVDACKHAFAEVIANAIAFSKPDGEVMITGRTTGNVARVDVIDHGHGIPLDEIERVFEPYYQVNRRRQEQQGIGLGLTLARGILQAHGGDLELYSTLGVGTQATVSLPVQ